MKSFREQSKLFWKAFFMEEKKLRSWIDDLDHHQMDVETLMKQLLHICFLDPTFEVGKGASGRYELILSPNGDPLTLLYHRELFLYMPKTLQRVWDVYEAKPKEDPQEISIDFQDKCIHQKEVFVSCHIKEERVDLDVYCEAMQGVSMEDRMQVIYPLLDASIGELNTMNDIGMVNFVSEKPEGSIPLEHLSAYLENLREKEGWENRYCGAQVYTNYAMQPKQRDFYLREDIYQGSTSQIQLINEMLQQGNYHVRIAEQQGIQIGFVFFEHSMIPPEERFLFRENLEEKLSMAFAKKHVSENIGSANGWYYTYLDYVVYDWEKFLALLVPVMEDANTLLYGFQPMILGAPPLYVVDNRPSGSG